jgi:hypothetical protein
VRRLDRARGDRREHEGDPEGEEESKGSQRSLLTEHEPRRDFHGPNGLFAGVLRYSRYEMKIRSAFRRINRGNGHRFLPKVLAREPWDGPDEFGIHDPRAVTAPYRRL